MRKDIIDVLHRYRRKEIPNADDAADEICRLAAVNALHCRYAQAGKCCDNCRCVALADFVSINGQLESKT